MFSVEIDLSKHFIYSISSMMIRSEDVGSNKSFRGILSILSVQFQFVDFH